MANYPSCPQWYIKNPDGTYMGLEFVNDIDHYVTPLNEVEIYFNGKYYSKVMLQRDIVTGAWYVPIRKVNSTYWYHVISRQCTPPQSSQPQPPSQPSLPQPQPIVTGGSSSSQPTTSTSSFMDTILKYKWYIVAFIFIIIVIYLITKKR